MAISTIKINEDLRDQVKHKAIDLKIKYNDFIIQAIKEKLERSES